MVDPGLVRAELRSGHTPDQVFARHGGRRAVYLMAIEEEARLAGELNAFDATDEAVRYLRDRRRLRWERIAARVFGEARETAAAKALYDEGKGAGAASRSYTGRGRRFPGMEDPS